jgi:hypothetical protein
MEDPPRALHVGLAVLCVAGFLAIVAAIGAAGAGGGTPADAERATSVFNDVGTARHAGYTLLKDQQGIACISMPGHPSPGAMGVHFVNGSLIADDAVRVTSPEALVYEPEAGGRMRLVAVEYVAMKGEWDRHHAKPPILFGHRFAVNGVGNRFGLPPFYSLHAWVWKHNPSGEFAMWNPDVRCGAS